MIYTDRTLNIPSTEVVQGKNPCIELFSSGMLEHKRHWVSKLEALNSLIYANTKAHVNPNLIPTPFEFAQVLALAVREPLQRTQPEIRLPGRLGGRGQKEFEAGFAFFAVWQDKGTAEMPFIGSEYEQK